MITIRRATVDDIEALVALQWRASLENTAYAEDLKANPDAISLPAEHVSGGHVFLAARDGKLAGFAVALPREDGDVELDGLFVDPVHWRYGIGRELTDRCVAHALISGAQTLHVVAAPEALGFYQTVGFVATGDVATRFGPAVAMKRAVTGR